MAKMTREGPSLSASRHSIDFPVRPVAGGSPRPPSAARLNRTASNPRPKGSQQHQQSSDEKAQAEWEQAKANHLAKMRYEQEQVTLAWSRNQRMLQQLDVKEEHLVVEGTLVDLWDLALLVEEFRGLYEVSNIAPFFVDISTGSSLVVSCTIKGREEWFLAVHWRAYRPSNTS